MSKSNDDSDWLKALYMMGWILVVVSTLPGAVLIFYAFITHTNMGIDGGAYAIGTIIMSGVVAMVYASIKGARKKRSAKT
jgi:Na+-driven multidrug efflux pump